MRPLDVIRETLSALAAHKLRTALSALGVVIGVAAVVAIVAMVQGASQQVQAQISGLGIRSIDVNLRTDLSATGSSATRLAQELREEPAVSEVVPIVNGSAEIDAAEEGGSSSSASQPARGASMRGPAAVSVAGQGRTLRLVGTTDDYAPMHDYTPVQGRFLHPLDEDRPVIVLGSGAAQQLRQNGLDPKPGEGLTLSAFGRRLHFQIVGVMGPRGRVGFNDLDQQAYVPASTLQRLSGSVGAESFLAQATSEDAVTGAATRIRSVLDERLDASEETSMRSAANPGPNSGPRSGGTSYTVRTQQSTLQTFQQTRQTLTLILGGVGAISLLVGAIGVMNIMLVSVTERTREVGVRMSVGARPREILLQFLAESILICVAGGLIGLGVGWVGAQFGAGIGGWPFVMSPLAAVLAVGFSTLVGILSGLYPAFRASRLDPVEALWHE